MLTIRMTDALKLLPVQRASRWIGRALAAAIAMTLIPTAVSAEPSSRTQTVSGLEQRAREVASEIDTLDRRTNELDEQYNASSLELADLRAKLADNQRSVDAARASLDSNRTIAQGYAVQAYVGTGQTDLIPADDIATDSRKRTYLTSLYGSREQLIDDVAAAQKDLADRSRGLQQATAKVDRSVAELARSRDELAATISARKKIYDTVQGDLAVAVEAERQRREAEAAAAAAAEARTLARRAQSASRPRAVAVVAAPPAIGATSTGRAEAPGAIAVTTASPAPARIASPPPSDAPIAVQVALAQQGDPYRWAGAGPDSFDCSGLVMFAYRDAGLSLPHSSRALRSMSESITEAELQPGDLVFGGSPIHHVGIYVGGGQMVHSPHSGDVVKVSGIYGTSKPVTFGRL